MGKNHKTSTFNILYVCKFFFGNEATLSLYLFAGLLYAIFYR